MGPLLAKAASLTAPGDDRISTGILKAPVSRSGEELHTAGLLPRPLEDRERSGDPEDEQARLLASQGLPSDIIA